MTNASRTKTRNPPYFKNTAGFVFSKDTILNVYLRNPFFLNLSTICPVSENQADWLSECRRKIFYTFHFFPIPSPRLPYVIFSKYRANHKFEDGCLRLLTTKLQTQDIQRRDKIQIMDVFLRIKLFSRLISSNKSK